MERIENGEVATLIVKDMSRLAVLNDMVKAVYVHAPDKSKGHREQQIDISYDLLGIACRLRRFPKTFLILSYERHPLARFFSKINVGKQEEK